MGSPRGVPDHSLVRNVAVPDEALFLRTLRQSDASAVFGAFASNLDMARQSVVTTAEEASAYVARLVDPGSPHEPWAVVESNALIGLVCITVDEDNRNGWFWYWMTDRARGRGVMSRVGPRGARSGTPRTRPPRQQPGLRRRREKSWFCQGRNPTREIPGGRRTPRRRHLRAAENRFSPCLLRASPDSCRTVTGITRPVAST